MPAAQARLVCFAHAGGSAAAFRSWDMGPDVEVVAVQYPGRADRFADPFPEGLEQLGREVGEAIATLDGRPTALFGHSLGALVAYEAARHLEGIGQAPVHLFASACRSPQVADSRPPIAELDDAALAAEVMRMGGTDALVLEDLELRDLILPYIRADFALLEAYAPVTEPLAKTPVLALGAVADPYATGAEVAGWSGATRAGFRAERFAGDHFYLVPRQEEVLATLRAALGAREGRG
ncbi:thioesterase II family protein [Streptomyces lavendulae]|uniref:thioesterase II family protein n=1 Tax=Streptomyces lavendulae TaxID=1914 RepID=UPI0024A1BB1F|nr:alpha/beta fold hydrolase [Streptomyces lavendulae]GLX21374.1 thioesterase [Streptomyces lavendulae subsp. lavendulae]GLX27892.1 thioesterase [Streptomyces lavendulae subsp. lavendulae]